MNIMEESMVEESIPLQGIDKNDKDETFAITDTYLFEGKSPLSRKKSYKIKIQRI